MNDGNSILTDDEWNKAEQFTQRFGESVTFWGSFLAMMKATKHPTAEKAKDILFRHISYMYNFCAVYPGDDFITITFDIDHHRSPHSGIYQIPEFEVLSRKEVGTEYVFQVRLKDV